MKIKLKKTFCYNISKIQNKLQKEFFKLLNCKKKPMMEQTSSKTSKIVIKKIVIKNNQT